MYNANLHNGSYSALLQSSCNLPTSLHIASFCRYYWAHRVSQGSEPYSIPAIIHLDCQLLQRRLHQNTGVKPGGCENGRSGVEVDFTILDVDDAILRIEDDILGLISILSHSLACCAASTFPIIGILRLTLSSLLTHWPNTGLV